MRHEIVAGDCGVALSAPSRLTPQFRLSQQPAQISVTGAILDQDIESRARIEHDLRTDERANARVFGGAEKTWRTVHAVTVSERERAVAEMHGFVDEVLGKRGAAQEAERALAAQLDVVSHRF